ncbi:hypothetical protein IW262DRAFT_1396374, partial [Armillaria fumosa]
MDEIRDLFDRLVSLLSSESETSDADVEAFAYGMSIIFDRNQFLWMGRTPVFDYYGMDYAGHPRSQAGSDTNNAISMMTNTSEMEIKPLVDFMLLLINRHRERILYAWVEGHSCSTWRHCVLRLIQWAAGEEFRRWAFLNRVLVIVVIRELQRRLHCTDFDEEVEQLPWLRDIYSPVRS